MRHIVNAFILAAALPISACAVEPDAVTSVSGPLEATDKQGGEQLAAKAETIEIGGVRLERSTNVGDRSLWATDWSVWLRSGTPGPGATTHPAGVRTVGLFPGTFFLPGSFVAIGKSLLTMQSNGNFVLYDENSVARWAANTHGLGAYAEFQSDANLVVYDANNRAIHTGRVPSNTCCHTGGAWSLHIQADGNAVIYAPGWQVRWATNTAH